MKIVRCSGEHLAVAAALFNAYRMFYGQASDLPGCTDFIRANLDGARSRLYLLFDNEGQAVGFSQLYPVPCSISLQPAYYLSDLYIDPARRRHGYARQLMEHITELFQAEGVHRLTLDTASSNLPAQALYESLGYRRERVYITYHQMLDGDGAEESARQK